MTHHTITEALKPCPFCGGKASQRTEHDGDGVRWGYVACNACGVRTPGKWGELCPITWAEIRDDWNRRAQEAAPAEPSATVEPHDPDLPVTRSLLVAAAHELRRYAIPAGADDQVVANLERICGIPHGEAAPAAAEGRTLNPLETIDYWANAYTDPASGPHFQGHGKAAELLREYAAYRRAHPQPAQGEAGSAEKLIALLGGLECGAEMSDASPEQLRIVGAAIAEQAKAAGMAGQGLVPQQMRDVVIAFCQRFPSYWERLTHECGRYDITELNHPTFELVRAIQAACAEAWGVKLASDKPASEGASNG